MSIHPSIITVLWLVFFALWFVLSLNAQETERGETSVSRRVHLVLMGSAFVLVAIPLFSVGVLALRFVPESAMLVGVVVQAGGIAFAIWARYHLGQYWSGRITIKEGHKLIHTGPYRWVRHPIYTGFVVGMIGTAIAVGEVRGLVAVLFVLVAYIRKIDMEEGFLLAQFGDEYAQYQLQVKALIPFIF